MAVAANPLEAFVWGAGGAKKTPEQVAREREIAAALMKGGVDYSPVDHWLQGAARAAQAGVGAFKDWRADNAETAGREGYQSRWDNIFGSGQTASADPVASALMGAPQTASDATAAMGSASASPWLASRSSPVTPPSGEQAAYVRNGLIQRGLPEHVADAFLLNFQDESGFDPGVNEAAPTVPGSRGGYGLYQLTGPRRVAYEQYAQQLGVDPSNVDAQLDFMMSELQGPEAAAAQAILSAPDTGSAAAAIVNKFLRPAEEHRARRVAQYTGGGGASQQVAQALMGGGNAAGGASPSMQELIGLASDPWANDSQKAIVQSLLGQQMQQQAQANDPLRQLQIQTAQKALETPTEQWAKLDDNTLYNQATGETKLLGSPGTAPTFEGTGLDAQAWNILQSADPGSKEYATAYSIIAQPKPQMVQTENGMMLVPVSPQLPAWLAPPGGSAPAQMPQGGPGMAAPAAPQVSPQGQSQANPAVFGGATAAPAQQPAEIGTLIPNTRKPSTEAQQRNEMLGTVLTSDLQIINDSFDALADPGGQLLGKIPGGLGNPWQSEEYQQAANAVSSSVSNILYSVSGASANPGELQNQIRNLTPQLGDKPGTIADKKRRLNTFVNAVAGASGNPELIARAREESLRGLSNETAAPSPGGDDGYPEGTVIEDDNGRQMIMRNGQWQEVM